MQYDVIIIGGGPGGSTAAFYLAQAGLKTLVLEKEKFPREHVGESLIPFCYHLFEEMGFLEHMKQNYLRKPGVTFASEDNQSTSDYCFQHVIKDDSYLSFHVRRAFFDQDLLQHAMLNGAEVKEEHKVISVEMMESGVSVISKNASNDSVSFHATFLIDASGQKTFLANKFNSKKPFERLQKRVAFSAHWQNANWTENLKAGNIEIVQLEGKKLGWIWMIPVDKDRLSIGLAVNMSYMKDQRKTYVDQDPNWQKAFYLNEINSATRVKNIIQEGNIIQGNYSASPKQRQVA